MFAGVTEKRAHVFCRQKGFIRMSAGMTESIIIPSPSVVPMPLCHSITTLCHSRENGNPKNL
jgi:hypothetical protein